MDKKLLLPVVIVSLTNGLGATMINPILPLYAVDQLGGTIFQATLLATAYFAAKFVAAPILGRMSDNFGRRPLLIISQAGTMFSFILFIFALPLGQSIDGMGLALGMSGGLIMLYIARILDGATGGNSSIARAYVADISRGKRRTQALGLLSASQAVGLIIGPAVGGLLAIQFGLVSPFVGGAIMAAGALLLIVVMLIESLPAEKRHNNNHSKRNGMTSRQILDNPALMLVFAISFTGTLCFAAITPIFALYADRVLFPQTSDPALVGRNVGLIFMLLGLVLVITQGVLLKPLVDYLGERKLIAIAQLTMALTFLTIPLSTNPIVITIVLVPFTVAYGVSGPSLQALVTHFGEAQVQGQLLGAYESLLSLAFLSAPIWAGYVFDYVSPQAIWWVGAAILAPAFVLALRLTRYSLLDNTGRESL